MRTLRQFIFIALTAASSGSAAFGQLVSPGSGKVWSNTWSDEFNVGQSDLTGWSYDLGGGGWGNQELEVYTNSTQNVYVGPDSASSASALHIDLIASGTTGNRSYTSGRIKTTNVFSQAYGLFEFRAKTPAGQGLWPAVWMMSKDESYGGWPTSGEIDVLETMGQNTGLVQGSLHSGSSPGTHVTQTRTFSQSGQEPPGFSTTAWHTYDLLWDQGTSSVAATFKWYVDGILYSTYTGGWFNPTGGGTNKDAPFDKPFYFLINLAVGGTYPGAPNIANGTYGMQVDYLRAYTRVNSIGAAAQWKNDAGGNWSSNANWISGVIPNAVGAQALFGNVTTQPRLVTVDTPMTIGVATFDSAVAYTLGGSQTLTIDALPGSGAVLSVVNGNHTITAPLQLADSSTNFAINSASASLSVTSLSASSIQTITKTGPGTLALKNIRSGGSLNVSAGTVQMTPDGTASGVSTLQAYSIAPAAVLDLTNNSLVVDYTGSVGTRIDDLRQHLFTGRLTSSLADATHRLGYADNAVLGLGSFGGQSLDASSIIVKYTFAGDANLDGTVDVTDLGKLASAWQTSGVWTDGDFNYDGFVDVTDLGFLATNWQAGTTPGAPAAGLPELLGFAAVPEPAALSLVSGLIIWGLQRRRRG